MSNGIPVEVFVHSMQWCDRQDLAMMASVNKETSQIARDSLLQIVTVQERTSRLRQIIDNNDVENVQVLLARRPDLMNDYLIEYGAYYGEGNDLISIEMRLIFLRLPAIHPNTRLLALYNTVSHDNLDFAENIVDLNLPFFAGVDRTGMDEEFLSRIIRSMILKNTATTNLSLFKKIVDLGFSVDERDELVVLVTEKSATDEGQEKVVRILLDSGPISEDAREDAYEKASNQGNKEIMHMLDIKG